MKAFGIIVLLGVVATLPAQENRTNSDLNREMTLERAYDPSVQDANKVNTLPAVREPVITKIPIDYAVLSLPAEPAREISLLPAAPVMTAMQYKGQRGYLNLGVGTYLNLNGDVGYPVILRSGKDRLTIFLSHRSTNGDVKFLTDSGKVRAKLNDNLGGINFRHRFDLATLNIGAKYSYSTFNYYGAYLPSPALADVDTATNQANGEFTINAGIESVEDAPVGYLLAADYTNFSYKYGSDGSTNGLTEHSVGAKAGLSTEFGGNQRIGIGGKFNYYYYARPDSGNVAAENHLEATITPYYLIENNTWNIRIGANLMAITGNNRKLFVSPNLAANIRIGDKTTLYVNAGGEIRSNSLYKLSRENRYINPYDSVAPSRTSLNAVAGIKSGAITGFRFNIFGEYKITDNDYFFVPYRNMSRTLLLNSKRWRGGMIFEYVQPKVFEAALKGIYNRTKLPDGHKSYGRPVTEWTASINVHPVKRAALGLSYYLAAGRKTLLSDGEIAKMKNISELNFTGSYTFNDTFGVYLKLNNLLFQQYELFYGYPLQGFNAMAGININF
ncbi:MAG: TonB-dependent receptor [Bacteroidales bacterium]